MFETIELTNELRKKAENEEQIANIFKLKNGDEWIPCRVVSCKSVVQVTIINPMWRGGSKQMFMTPQAFSRIPKQIVDHEKIESLFKWEVSKDPKKSYNIRIREF